MLSAGAASLALAASIGGCGGGEEGSGGAQASGKSGSTVTVTAATTATTASQAPAPAASSTSSPGRSTSQAAPAGSATSVVAAANADCARGNAEVAALARVPVSAGLAKVASGALRRAALEQRVLGELGKLAPPAGGARDWREVVEYREAARRRTLEFAAHARAHDLNAVRSLMLVGVSTPVTVLVAATRSGLNRCDLREPLE